MSPASNSEARKRTEAADRPATVLVEIPVDLAVRHLDREPGTEVAIDALIQQALAGRVDPIGDRVRPDAAEWAGRHG